MMRVFETLRNLFRRFKLFPKIMCMIMAIILWAWIGNRQTGRLMVRVPIEYKNLGERLVISEYSDKYVSVALEGKKEYLKGVTEKNLKAYVDLANPALGISKNYSINFIRMQIPDNLTMNPTSREVTLMVERIRNKWVKVIPHIVGNPPPGTTLGKLKVQPEYVMISGAMSILREIDYVPTDDISINDQYEDITRNVEINQDKFADLQFSDTTVRVTVPVIKNESVYMLELPLRLYNVDARFTAEAVQGKIKVYLKGNGEAKIDPESIEAYIDASGVNYQQLLHDNMSTYEKALPVSVKTKQGKITVGDLMSTMPENAVIILIKK